MTLKMKTNILLQGMQDTFAFPATAEHLCM